METFKSARREAQRKLNRYRPRGNPKFLVLMIEQQIKRDKERVEKTNDKVYR